MASPVADTYSAPSGATLYAGRDAPGPAWRVGVPVNKIIQISGTVLAGSAGAPGDNPLDEFCESNRCVRAYSGMAVRHDTSEIFVPASGGHADGSNNCVRSIRLSDDSPAWQMRHVASDVDDRVMDSPYYLDGLPSSRHSYWSPMWCEQRNRIMLHGSRWCWGSTTFNDSNGFNPTNNTWDADGTWSDVAGLALCSEPDTGDVWAVDNNGGIFKWTCATDTWAQTGTFDSSAPFRPPMAYDSSRDELFSLAIGDGQATGSGVNAFRVTANGTSRQAISFASSAAYTQWLADAPAYAALIYDPDNDRYLTYAGTVSGSESRIYAITPNAGTTWDMALLSLASGSVTPPLIGSPGVMNRFQYVPALKGVVLFANAITNILFMPTAEL